MQEIFAKMGIIIISVHGHLHKKAYSLTRDTELILNGWGQSELNFTNDWKSTPT